MLSENIRKFFSRKYDFQVYRVGRQNDQRWPSNHNENGALDNEGLDKAPRLTIRRVIWILASVFVNSTNTTTNIETAMLST